MKLSEALAVLAKYWREDFNGGWYDDGLDPRIGFYPNCNDTNINSFYKDAIRIKKERLTPEEKTALRVLIPYAVGPRMYGPMKTVQWLDFYPYDQALKLLETP